ncbi:1-hydroxycarotenoid 3,4-desaturase CrtD [Alterisphingorhabdus coralli]|uniref:Phytoene desaturase family protein n=1 Tax=Alterisphingorhabdus coralli TaxID=3071408 RepID=A0AA97F585_9SPHN|nr:1-hydroxycarotenoid 3,4-desaturase CrtD [Parasphingorhabdus sp. SCSIO 66989]WOE74514.1 phytoene desaturase family protein [Parasphingorhabdus sp. SCSIO 66989]
MKEAPVIIIGAGIGGLVSAALLSARGVPVMVVEKEQKPGGKARKVDVAGHGVDAGPTVFTMRPSLEAIFADAGAELAEHLDLKPADRIARHAWDDREILDLFADEQRSIDAIGDFAGAQEAEGFRRFSRDAQKMLDILNEPFMHGSKTNPFGLMRRVGWSRVGKLLAIRPFQTMWSALGSYFKDARLQQLFGRYSTYCGSSPFETPATLMLIASVEARGVWLITGGMSALAKALETVAANNGAAFHYGDAVKEITVSGGKAKGVTLANGKQLDAQVVICNADPSALGTGLFGAAATKAVDAINKDKRSLSAMVWLAHAKTDGFELDHHNVFFSDDYPREFAQIASGKPPDKPTAYVCALDRGTGGWRQGEPERLQVIVNAPANGDSHEYTEEEKERCTANMLHQLSHCGLDVKQPMAHQLVTPSAFHRLFPATGGALYGRASHGWAASFLRPGSRTRVSGLYCTGGGTHPGAGVPMAALSGRIASQTVLEDHFSTRMSRPPVITGGISTHSATTSAMD